MRTRAVCSDRWICPIPRRWKNGPFYALFVKLFHENAVGGMATDSQVRVLKGGKPIPGLYGAGDNIRGIMLPRRHWRAVHRECAFCSDGGILQRIPGR